MSTEGIAGETLDRRVHPRPVWQIVLIGLVVGGWLVAALLFWHLRFGRTALAVEVTIESDRPLRHGDVRVGWEFRGGDFRSPEGGVPTDRGRQAWSWEIREAWVRSLILSGHPAALRAVRAITIRVGDRVESFPRANRRAAWKPLDEVAVFALPRDWDARWWSADRVRAGSVVGALDGVMNYPGDGAILGQVLGHPAFVGFLALWLVVLLLSSRLRSAPVRRSMLEALLPSPARQPPCGEPRQGRGARWSRAAWWVAGFGLVAACLAWLEAPRRYHFTQGDNYRQFLPGMLHGCRALESGSLPTWNPHQFLGAPLAEVGTYALTYPVTYLAYAGAKHVGGNEYITLEVFCVLHLIGAYCAFWWLGSELGLAPAVASAGAACFALSGYALVAGSNWYYMTPTFLVGPLLGVSALRIARRNPGWRWIVGTGTLVGIYSHAGNAQMWVYGMAFFGIAVLWACWSSPARYDRLAAAAAAGSIGLGIAAILLVPQFAATRGIARAGAGGWDALDGLHAMVVPFPLGKPHWGVDSRHGEVFGEVYYAGSLFTVAWLAGLLAAWIYPGRIGPLMRSALFTLGLLALLLSLGDAGVLWYAQARLPVLNAFRHPVKLLPFFHLFSLAGGCVVVDRLTSQSGRAAVWKALSFVVVSALLVYHVALISGASVSFAAAPYPAMPEALDRLLRQGALPARVMPVPSSWSLDVNFPLGLADDYGSVYRVDSIGGLDPLVSFRPEYRRVEGRMGAEPLNALQRYGVTHLVVHEPDPSSRLRGLPRFSCYQQTKRLYWFEPFRACCAGRKPLYEDAEMRVFAVDGAAPIAFPAREPTRALPVAVRPSEVTVDVRRLPEGTDIVVNYLWYRNTRVSADGRPIVSCADAEGRIVAAVPPGTRTLAVGYGGPWHLGLGLGAVLIVLGNAIAWGRSRRVRSSPTKIRANSQSSP